MKLRMAEANRLTQSFEIHGVSWKKKQHAERFRHVSYEYTQIGVCQASQPIFVNFTGLADPPLALRAFTNRSLSSGAVMNIIKPPPPAPETLPAVAPLLRASA
jgi:hypothetical protein